MDDPVISQPNVWKSYVWHDDQCFFVSTIRRVYDSAACGATIGMETLVWKYDFDAKQRGELIGHMGGIVDHQRICRCLINDGEMLDDDKPEHKRFFE